MNIHAFLLYSGDLESILSVNDDLNVFPLFEIRFRGKCKGEILTGVVLLPLVFIKIGVIDLVFTFDNGGNFSGSGSSSLFKRSRKSG